MKNIVIAFVLCFCSVNTLAADSTLVKLMQTVIDLKVPAYYRYFYLLEDADAPSINGFRRNEQISLGIPIDELIKNSAVDTVSLKWSSHVLQRAKCVDFKHLPKHVYAMIKTTHVIISNDKRSAKILNNKNNDAVAVYVKKNASQKDVDIAVKKATAIHNAYCEKANDALPLEERNYFRFSRPVFSNNRQYAYVEIMRSDGGSQCVFKNINGNWVIFQETRIAY